MNVNNGNKTISISFDINAIKKYGFREHYSNYVSDMGNTLDLYEIIVDPGMYLVHGTILPYETECIAIEAKNDYVYFVFVIDNNRTYTIIDKDIEPIPVSTLEQMAFVMKKGSLLRFYIDTKKPNTVFELCFSIDYLMKILPKKHFLYERLYQSKKREESTLLYDFPVVFDVRMKTIFYDMLYCRFSEIAKSMFIKSKLLEFFALQQLGKESSVVEKKRLNISEEERNRMLQARDILLVDLRSPPTIFELARLVGTNECYLKQNFKIVFGSTIYGYVKQVKMERARKLLVQKKNINEVARMIGYKHSNHFSTAFKKHFGYVPNKVG